MRVLYGPDADIFILGNRTQETVEARAVLDRGYSAFVRKNIRRAGGSILEQTLAPGETVMIIGYKNNI